MPRVDGRPSTEPARRPAAAPAAAPQRRGPPRRFALPGLRRARAAPLGPGHARGRARAAGPPAGALLHAGARAVAARFCDVVLAQDAEPRIPVLEMVDAKLAAGKLDGYRYDDMPEDRTWRRVLRGLDRTPGAGYDAALRRLDRPTGARSWRPSQDLPVGEPWDELTAARRGRDARRWRRSTRTRGRGTRSASAARPTRAATCAWASTRASTCSSRERARRAIRCPSRARRAGPASEPTCLRGRCSRARSDRRDNDSPGPARRLTAATPGCAPTCAASPTTTRSTW